MQKILASVAISLSALMASSALTAAPQVEYFPETDTHTPSAYKHRDKRHTEDAQYRSHEQRGMKRLKQMKWQTGYVMPQHYRSDGYKVEYKDNDLPKPSRNQQWYKVNNHYILLNSDTNSIVKIQD